MSFYVPPCRQSCYYDAGATARSEQVVGKTFITPVGRRKLLLAASVQPLRVCAQNCIYTPTLLHYLLLTLTCSHTVWLRAWMLIREWRKWQYFLCFSRNYVLSVCPKSPLSMPKEVKVCYWVSERHSSLSLSLSPPPLLFSPPLSLRLSLPHIPLSWQIESSHQGFELLNSLQRGTAVSLDLSGPAANHTFHQSPVLMVRKCFVRWYHSYVATVIFVKCATETLDHVKLSPLCLTLSYFLS